MSQNFVPSLECFFILLCVERSIISLFRSKTTILNHTKTILPVIVFTTFFSWVWNVMFDNDFWYMISYFLDVIFFLIYGDSIFVLMNVTMVIIMGMWLPIFAVITLARISADNAMLETLAVLLLTLRPFACTTFEMDIFRSGVLDLLFKCVYSLPKDFFNGFFPLFSLFSDVNAALFDTAAFWTTVTIVLQALTVKLWTSWFLTFAANLGCYSILLFQLVMRYGRS